MRIFGGLLRTGAQQNPDVADIEPFLVLHLDIASEPCGSVAAALQRHLEQAPPGAGRAPGCTTLPEVCANREKGRMERSGWT